MAYYYYKMVADNGGAPCVYRNLLSLAICKPKIRASANVGDWVFGFGGKRSLGERLIYIARITDKVEDGTYYRDPKYQKRSDRVYGWSGGRLR